MNDRIEKIRLDDIIIPVCMGISSRPCDHLVNVTSGFSYEYTRFDRSSTGISFYVVVTKSVHILIAEKQHGLAE